MALIRNKHEWIATVLAFAVLFGLGRMGLGQTDQGTITGVTQDPSGAVIANVSITLTSVDTGQELKTKSNRAGVYSFPPVRIGNYSIIASVPGFGTTTLINQRLNLQQHLNVVVTMMPGTEARTISTSQTTSQMQTQESSISQVTNAQSINKVPLSGGNWVYIAQLSAGAAPPQGTHGAGTGDFNSNGQRAEQNNYILDGVDNSNHLVDLGNGASFVAQPPPDGLAEFSVQSGNYSAEFGHAAGAIVNASLRSGTNDMHGSVWEYVRNTAFDARDWNATFVPPYHQNLFGVALGLPAIRNKLFFFGDVQANRIAFKQTDITTVPSLLERSGNFSELLNPSLTGASAPIQLYHQDSNLPPQPFPGNNLASGGSGVVPNATALSLLRMLPPPNTNNGLLYNNYLLNAPAYDYTTQWDSRLDWNIGAEDIMSIAFSYWNEPSYQSPLFGVLDGGARVSKNQSGSFVLSETHIITPTLTNQLRVGFNDIRAQRLQVNAATAGLAGSLGFGGIPGGLLNGGTPTIKFLGGTPSMASFGSGGYLPTNEDQNVYELIDNVTRIIGNHNLKAGVSFLSIRFSTLSPPSSRGTYSYNGEYTSDLNAPNTGFSLADFVMDSQNSAVLSSEFVNGQARWYDAAYFQDDWRITKTVTINAGMRWEYFQPYKDVGGYQATYHMTGLSALNPTTGRGSGSAVFEIPSQAKSYVQSIFTHTSNVFPNLLAKDNVALQYSDNQHLLTAQKLNFGPRLGLAWSLNSNTVIRAGYGLFYGGLESAGYMPNLGQNYPFEYNSTFLSQSCSATSCPTDGIAIGNGFSTILANGLASEVTNLGLRGADAKTTTAYTEDYNLSIQRNLIKGILATVSYVGDTSHHLGTLIDPNNPLALQNPSNSAQNARPLPDFSGTEYTAHMAASNYNGLQVKVEKQYSHGNSLLATYTWSHSLDDAPAMMIASSDRGYRQTNLVPTRLDYSNSAFDTRQRFTFNAMYDFPLGLGRRFLNRKGVLSSVAGGWSTNTAFTAQTGNPFSVNPTGISLASGGAAAGAVRIKNPYATGGSFTSPDPSIKVVCATHTRTRENWYNPCSFENPWNPNDWSYEPSHYIPTSTADPHYGAAGVVQPDYVSSLPSVLGFMGGRRNDVYGPGYERVSESIFKVFTVHREHTLQFRVDIFNLLNTPSLGQPSDMTIASTGGTITSPRLFQKLTPDARFVQLSLKYSF
jgi:hypothetical protein